ncbi:MAG: MFS transporter [Rudaea sp.]
MFNVIILGIASFLTDVSSEMVYPLLPLYLTSVLGATPAIVGIIEGLAESSAALLRVFSGYFSDRLGRRKPLTISGYLASAIGKFILYLSYTWPLVLFSRLIDRFGKGIRTAPRDALIADSTAADQRGAGFGLHRALDTLGAVVGVTIAYFLFITVKENFNAVFLVSVVPAILGVAVLFLVREVRRREMAPLQDAREPTPNGQTRMGTARQPWWQNLGARWAALDSRLKGFIIIVLLFNLGNSSNQFLLLRSTSLGFDDAGAILLYLAYNVVYALIAYPAGRLSDRIGRKRLLVAGYLTYGLIYFAFAVATHYWMLPLFGLYGLYIALTEGVEKALVSDLAPLNFRATLIGLHATALGVGLLPASVLAGVLYGMNPAFPFFFGGIMGVSAAVALWLLI